MSNSRKLEFEVLSGSLDGAVLTLDAGAEWTRSGEGPLCFPWDEELGAPQARIEADDGDWTLAPVQSPHGTYRINQGECVEGKVQLNEGEILKASATWLLVRSIE